MKKNMICYSLLLVFLSVFLGVFIFQLFDKKNPTKSQNFIDFSKARLTSLMKASSMCFTERVQALIDSKCGDECNPKFRESVFGLTPLILAAQNKSEKCKSTIDLLIKNGADTKSSIGDHKELVNIIALTFNILKGHPNATQSLMINLDQKLIEAHFLYTVGLGRDKIVRKFIDGDRVNIDVTGREGQTALILAARGCHFKMASHLIDVGAQLDIAETTNGGTALMYASAYGCPKIVRKLLKAGADKDKENYAGQTAMHLAILHKQTDIIKIFP